MLADTFVRICCQNKTFTPISRCRRSEFSTSRSNVSSRMKRPAESAKRKSEPGEGGPERDARVCWGPLPSQLSACLRLSFSAFARYPNGVVVHYFCCKNRTACPSEQ